MENTILCAPLEQKFDYDMYSYSYEASRERVSYSSDNSPDRGDTAKNISSRDNHRSRRSSDGRKSE